MNLEIAISKYNLGELSIREFPKLALELIKHGEDNEYVSILAGLGENNSDYEIENYLNYVIDELNVKVYESLDAAFILANYYVKRMKSGSLGIKELVYRIKNECWDNCHAEIQSEKYYLDGIKFQGIIGPWYELNEMDEFSDWVKRSPKSLKQLKSEIENSLMASILQWEEEFLKDKIEQITNGNVQKLSCNHKRF